MKILVVGDSHGDLRSMEAVIARHADAAAVIFLGDGMRDAEALQDEHPSLRLYAVRGNCDFASFAPSDGLVPFAGTLFFYTHGHLQSVKSGLDRLAETAAARGADVALFGHTHEPALCEAHGVTLFNPGSVSVLCGRGTYGLITIENGARRFEHLPVQT